MSADSNDKIEALQLFLLYFSTITVGYYLSINFFSVEPLRQGADGTFPRHDIPRIAERIHPPVGAVGVLQRGNFEKKLEPLYNTSQVTNL